MDGRIFEQPPLMTPSSAARYLGLQRCTLDRWRCTGSPLPFYKIGGRIFYKRADLDAYIEACKRNSTAEPSRLQAANDAAPRAREKRPSAPIVPRPPSGDTQLSLLHVSANDAQGGAKTAIPRHRQARQGS
jgi:excisionase family DNA binding protein